SITRALSVIRTLPATRAEQIVGSPVSGESDPSPRTLSLVPGGERLQVGNPGQPGFRVGRDSFRRHDDVEQSRSMRERAIYRRREIVDALDSLAVHAEGARHRRVIGKGKARPDDLAVRFALIVHLDLPGAVVGDDDEYRSTVTHRGVDFHRVEA